MDVEYLLSELESLAYKIHVPGFLDLIDTVRNMYEKTTEVIAPHEPISDASRTLTALYTELESLCSQLEISLPAFKTTYTGAGSDVYHTSAAFALQGMQQQRDALAYAAQQHQILSDQLALAREMQITLTIMLGAVVVTLAALVVSAGVDAPITVPAAIVETLGAGGIIATLTEALASASIAMNALLAFLATEEGLGLLAATGITLVALTHPQMLTHPITSSDANAGKFFSNIKTTPEGKRIRVRKLSPGEVNKLRTPWGEEFHDIKGKQYDPTDVIYVDQNGGYWIGNDKSDNVDSFP